MVLLENSQIKENLKAIVQREQKSTVGGGVEDEELNTQMDIEKSILPSLANFLEKLDHELLKAYQNISHTKIEYLQRIRDENKFLFLCDTILKFISEFNDFPKAARVAILKLDHLYYKND